MNLDNATKMAAEYTVGMDPTGREHIVVAVKGTFTIPEPGLEPVLAEEQVPLTLADEFFGEPGLSATRYESDFALTKPRCDVLLHGSAHAPGGRPTGCVEVGLWVGPIAKSFEVVGDRRWDVDPVGARITTAMPFVTMPISYDRAFGGTDPDPTQPELGNAYMANPVGVGHYPLCPRQRLHGKPLPNTRRRGEPITSTKGRYAPMSFGPVGRNTAARIAHAGTYDQRWLDEHFPFLPPDFSNAYFQAAPTDQQMDHPRGGEEVVLLNLTPNGRTAFRLPTVSVPVEFTSRSYDYQERRAVADTIVIEPDQGRLMITWRASLPIRQSVFEIVHIVVGKMPAGWYRARACGKTYYPSLSHLARANREAATGEDG